MLHMDPGNFWKTIPKKRMASGALIFNEKNELLIVKPAYKNTWSIPGGVIDANESPREACVREIKEEIGLAVTSLRFLCVTYYRNPGTEKGESLQFMFHGGTLENEDIARMMIPKEEISEFRFLPVEAALPLLGKGLAHRIPLCIKALKKNQPIYLERESSDS